MFKKLYGEIVRRSTAVFHIDAAYYAKSNIALYSGYAVDMLRGIILAALLARLLTPEVYGEYRFVLSFLPIFAYFALPAAAEGVIQGIAKGEDRTFRRIYILVWKWSLLSLPAVAAVAAWCFWQKQTQLAWIFVGLAPLMPAYGATGLFTAYLLGKQKFQKLLRNNVIVSMALLFAMSATVLWCRTIWWLVFVFVAVNIMARLTFDLRVWTQAKNGGVDELGVSYAKRVSWLTLLLVIRSNFDKILLGTTTGFVNLALYNVASVIPDQLKALGGISSQSMVARFVQRTDQAVVKVIDAKMKRLTLVALAVFVSALLATPLVLPIVFSGKYSAAIPWALLLIISVIPATLANPYITALQAKQEIKKLYIIHGSFAVIEILLQIILIPLFGLAGAVAVKLISRTVAAGTIFIVSHW